MGVISTEWAVYNFHIPATDLQIATNFDTLFLVHNHKHNCPMDMKGATLIIHFEITNNFVQKNCIMLIILTAAWKM